MFNIDGGYLEGLCRGFKCGILKQADYLNLVQCETLEGKRKSCILRYFKLELPLNIIGHARVLFKLLSLHSMIQRYEDFLKF